MSNPIDILYKAIQYGFLVSDFRKPGTVLNRMSKEDREILQQLTSDEAKQMRFDGTKT